MRSSGIVATLLDKNQDGAVSDEEAAAAKKDWPDLSREKTQLGRLLTATLDSSGNGRLNDEEIAAGVARGRQQARGVSQEVVAIFKALDTNADTRISVVEFRGLVFRLGPLGVFVAPKLAQFFNAMDVDGNGLISPAESQRGADYLLAQIEIERQRQEQLTKLRDPKYRQAQQLVATLDRNRDGRISKREASRNKEVKHAFQLADTDLNDELSVDECYERFKKVAAEQKKQQLERDPFSK